MTATRPTRSLPSPARQQAIRSIKMLLWAYFVLLLAEGALRKWLLVSLSTPLLLVRDPVVIGIYLLAWKYRLFPRNGFLFWMFPLAQLMLAGGFLAGLASNNQVSVPTILYGLRSNFLHLPLIFVMGAILKAKDIKAFGRFILLFSIPMAVLMALQFQASPEAWLNASPGGVTGTLLTAALGKIRPSGTFSFSTGPTLYFPLVVAFWAWGFVSRNGYSLWLLAGSGGAVILASAVSGSRGLVLAELLTLGALGIAAFHLPKRVMPKLLQLLGIGGLAGVMLGQLGVFQEGVVVFTERVRLANRSLQTGRTGLAAIAERFFGELFNPLSKIDAIPPFGHGLGLGTNVGAKLQTGEVTFLLSEGEWGRVLQESGPFIGLLLLLYRISVAVWLGLLSYRRLLAGETLPLLLYSAVALGFINGQWGVTNIQGLIVFGTGLCLAANQVPLEGRMGSQHESPNRGHRNRRKQALASDSFLHHPDSEGLLWERNSTSSDSIGRDRRDGEGQAREE